MNTSSPLATVVLDPITSLLFGLALALISARLIARNPERETLRTALFAGAWGLLYALSVSWLFFNRGDWMFMYLKDTAELPSLAGPFAVFGLIVTGFGALGAFANAALVRHGHRNLAWALAALVVVTLGATFWLQWRQYIYVGTFEAFHAGRATPLPQDATMQRVMNVSGAVSTVGAIALFVVRYLQARKAVLADLQARRAASSADGRAQG